MTDPLFGTILTGGTAGVIATLLFVLTLILTEKLVPGKAHDRERARADRFEKMSLGLLRIAGKAADAVTGTPTSGAGASDDDD
jgi:hypothetical protein